MKMVKSLLLGSATALVAIAGAQAADLPVKAAPVQYVKICSLYGAGFYYIPGTDDCIKIGGFVRAEYNYNAGGSFIPLANNAFLRTTNQNAFRVRALLTADVRTQTALGTLRSYLAMGETATNGTAAAGAQTYLPRAFIQLAGFTVGLTKSFYDYFSFASVSNQTNLLGSDTSGNGQIVFAYTAQFGNGLSASLSIEDPTAQRQDLIFTNGPAAGTALVTTALSGVIGWPDIVGNINLEQAWGSAQIMGALHDVSASYYNGVPTAGMVSGNGHPSDEVGYAIGGGITFKLPMLGKGDSVSIQADWAHGANHYTNALGGGFLPYDGATAARGYNADAVYSSVAGALGGLDLTDSWDIVGGYTHNWNPQWKTSLYGGYSEVNYSGSANSLIRVALGFPTGDADFSLWQIGSRTVWTPVKNLDLSVDVLYTQYNTGFAGNVAPTPAGASGTTFTYGDVDVWQAIFRWQRNFYP